jgi:hypothetical protein
MELYCEFVVMSSAAVREEAALKVWLSYQATAHNIDSLESHQVGFVSAEHGSDQRQAFFPLFLEFDRTHSFFFWEEGQLGLGQISGPGCGLV